MGAAQLELVLEHSKALAISRPPLGSNADFGQAPTMWSSIEHESPAEFAEGAGLCGGRFVVEGYVARGGVGAAYRARDVELERTVVCKVAHEADALAWAESRGQFEKLARIHSRDVVKPLGFFVHEQGGSRRPVLALEWIDGADFKDWAAVASVHERFKAVARIAAALAELHGVGLAHGDFQRGINVRVAGDDRIVLIDPDSEISGGVPIASDRMSLAGIIRGLLNEFVATVLGGVVRALDDPKAPLSMKDIAAQIASVANSVPLLRLDAPLVAAAADAHVEETAWRQRKYEFIRRQRALTFDRLAESLRALASRFQLDFRYTPGSNEREEEMRDSHDGQLVARVIDVRARFSKQRWYIGLDEATGFRKPMPYLGGVVIGRGTAWIAGDGPRQRQDLLELRLVDDVPTLFVASDPEHAAKSVTFSSSRPASRRDLPDPEWKAQTDTWIVDCLNELLGTTIKL